MERIYSPNITHGGSYIQRLGLMSELVRAAEYHPLRGRDQVFDQLVAIASDLAAIEKVDDLYDGYNTETESREVSALMSVRDVKEYIYGLDRDCRESKSDFECLQEDFQELSDQHDQAKQTIKALEYASSSGGYAKISSAINLAIAADAQECREEVEQIKRTLDKERRNMANLERDYKKLNQEYAELQEKFKVWSIVGT